MADSVIIDIDKNFLYKDELLFKLGKLNENKIIKKIKFYDKNCYVFILPVSLKNIFNEKKLCKIIKKFINFLINKNVKKIILSKRAEKIKNLKEKLEKFFYIFNGKKVINFCFSNIIKKYINKEQKENYEIVFLSNNIDSFYYYFKKLFHNYRICGVITDNIIKFKEMSEVFYQEYGFLLNIYDNKTFQYKDNSFLINIDTEFLNNKIDIDINKISVIFNRSEKLLCFYNYFEIINEKVLEYLINLIFGYSDKSNITEFFHEFNIRVVKINKK